VTPSAKILLPYYGTNIQLALTKNNEILNIVAKSKTVNLWKEVFEWN